MVHSRLVASLAACCLLAMVGPLAAAGLKDELPNIPSKTMGGQYCWADELVYFGWRIQRNTFTGHCRLLDGEKRRQTYGTFAQCQTKLEEIKRQRKLPPMKGKAVLVLGGLGDPRVIPEGMAQFLQGQGYMSACVAYPSLFDDIGQHAKALDSVVRHLDESSRSTSSATAWATWSFAVIWATRPTRPPARSPTSGSSGL